MMKCYRYRRSRVLWTVCLVALALVIFVGWTFHKPEEQSSIRYVTYAGFDSPGNSLVRVALPVSRLKLVCTALPECVGFDTAGWLKTRLHLRSSPGSKVYVKRLIATTSLGQESPQVDPQAGIFRNWLREYSKMESQLKIYIYKTQVGVSMPFFSGYTYGVERLFFKLLADSPFRTADPNEATFFFVPTRCSAYQPQAEETLTGDAMAANITAQLLGEIVQKYPYWNASLGTDHFYVCAHDMGTKVTALADRNLFKNAVALVNTADTAAPFFVPHKDISLPPHPGRGTIPWHELGLGGAGVAQEARQTLLFFAGSVTRGALRPKLMKYFASSPDFYLVPGNISEQQYIKALKTSKFCLCPRGNEVWSPHIMDALWFGCVPVLVADHYVPPLSSLVNWDDVAITVPEKELHGLRNILMNIDPVRLLSLQGNIIKVWKHLTWNDPPRPFDAFHGVLFELWLKRWNLGRVR